MSMSDYRVLPDQADVHGRLRRQLLHGEPRLHDGGPPPRPHVLLRGGRVQPSGGSDIILGDVTAPAAGAPKPAGTLCQLTDPDDMVC